MRFLDKFTLIQEEHKREQLITAFEEVQEAMQQFSQYLLMRMFRFAIGFQVYRGVQSAQEQGGTMRFADPVYFTFFKETAQKQAGQFGQVLTVNVPLGDIRLLRLQDMVRSKDSRFGQVLIKSGQYDLIPEGADASAGEGW